MEYVEFPHEHEHSQRGRPRNDPSRFTTVRRPKVCPEMSMNLAMNMTIYEFIGFSK